MAKIFSIFFSLSIILLNTSCRKDYSCTCISTFSGGSYTAVTVAKSTKQDATAWCSAIEVSSAQPNVTTTCSLK